MKHQGIVRLGLFMHGGDGPARWEVEVLASRGTTHAHVERAKAAAQEMAARLSHERVSCAWRWRVANTIQQTWDETLGDDAGPAIDIEHTHGAPDAFDAHGNQTRQHALYQRPYRPQLDAGLRLCNDQCLTRDVRRRLLRTRRALKAQKRRPSPSIRQSQKHFAMLGLGS